MERGYSGRQGSPFPAAGSSALAYEPRNFRSVKGETLTETVAQETEAAVHRQGTFLEVLGVALRLGLTSFGGPIAHPGYFRDEYVVRRKWLDE